MVFSSLSFIFFFLPIVLVIYFITPSKFKNFALFILSILFYMYGEPILVLLVLISTFSSYINGILMEKYHDKKFKKIFLIFDITLSLSLLAFFKYADFFITSTNGLFGSDISLLNLALPIGISFYTFQTISYSVDVYKRVVKAQKNFITMATYVVFFPAKIAGPIVRYKEMEKELTDRKTSFSGFSAGINRFIIGLAKKVIIANNIGLLAEIFLNSSSQSVVFTWLYGISFMLQIYFDFSGYTDMAIGLGSMFGFKIPENFNYPYIAKSITDFWRRWHMTLSFWFRDYVYIPLGGSRVSKLKLFRNLMIVWFLTGLWHGAAWNFVAFGLFFGIVLIIEKSFMYKILDKSPVFVRHLYTLFIVMISFMMFNATNFASGMNDIGSLFGFGNLPLITSETIYYLRSYFVIIIVAIIGTTPLPKNIINKLKENKKNNKIINTLEPIFIVAILIIATAYLVDGSFNPFIYFRF